MSTESRYYYVDAQNQAAGPIAMTGLLALKSAGTVTDATLVVIEGGTEWVAFSTLKPEGASKGGAETLRSLGEGGQPTASPETSAERARSEGRPSSASSAEPLWSSQLSQKIDQLTAAMDKLAAALEKTRTTNAAPVATPATAALHAEKINLNPTPKPGIAAQNPAPAPGVIPRPTPLPAGVPAAIPKPAGLPVAAPRPGTGTTLSPLAVPANAQKSPPLPSLARLRAPPPLPLPPPPPKGTSSPNS